MKTVFRQINIPPLHFLSSIFFFYLSVLDKGKDNSPKAGIFDQGEIYPEGVKMYMAPSTRWVLPASMPDNA